MLEDKTTTFFFLILLGILILALTGPLIAPYDYDERHWNEDGSVKSVEAPSADHYLGTTQVGYDVFSRILIGARPTAATGLLGGLIIITVGSFVGITAGYVGGRVDGLLMRITDVFYGIPLLPTAIVLVALLGVGYWSTLLIVGLILWRGSARVLRSQVLQIKERPYIKAAKATGASTPRIIFKHVFPNIATMAILFLSIGIGVSILVEASLAFLGVTSPFVPSWGIMLRNSYNTGLMARAWWWSIPPGLLISLTVLSTFMFGRGYESIVQDTKEGDEALVEGA